MGFVCCIFVTQTTNKNNKKISKMKTKEINKIALDEAMSAIEKNKNGLFDKMVKYADDRNFNYSQWVFFRNTMAAMIAADLVANFNKK